jgi:vitamin B12 transporter
VKRVSFCIALLAVPVFAQTQTPRIADQIIVTASDLPETVESTPATVTVVTKKEIDDRAARGVADVLREVPGLSVSRTGSLGKTTSVFVRGASSKQVLVLWNGIEINDPYFSGYNWGQFSTVGVQRIEVARGPFSSLYGADAVGGVVNIITSGGRDHADLDITGGGRGLFNGVTAFGQTSGSTAFDIAVEHRQDNGFAPNDNDRQNSLLGGFRFVPRSNVSIGLTGRTANYDLGVPRNTNDFATAYVATPHHREHGKEWQLAVPISAELGAIHTELRVSENHRDDRNEDPDAHSFGATTSMRRTLHVAARTATSIGTIVVGAEGEKAEAENHDSFGLDIDTHHRSSNAFFVEDRLSRGAFELSVGVRRDHYDTFGSETSPRIGAAWTRSGNKFHAAYGEAFRAPQIGELYLPFFGNPDLHAERSKSAEIGYDRFFDSGASVSITAFRNTFRDLIVYDLAASKFGNVGLARSRGVEIAATNRLGPFTSALSYTYLRAIEEPTGLQLARRPKHSGSLALGYDRGAGTAQLVVARVGSRPDVNDLFPFGTVTNAAYTVADLTLRWRMGTITPYAKIENLTNTRYQEVFGFPSPTRRALLGVRYSVTR